VALPGLSLEAGDWQNSTPPFIADYFKKIFLPHCFLVLFSSTYFCQCSLQKKTIELLDAVTSPTGSSATLTREEN
jgi:hypothetical protein